MNAAPWASPTPLPATREDEQDLKERFAEALLRSPTDPFRAALAIFGNDTVSALKASNSWPSDLVVLQRQADLLEEYGPDEYLPTKAHVARRIYEVGDAATDPKDRLAAFKLYADIRGFMPKAENVNNTNITLNQNRVMVVRDFGSDDQWETAAQKHQTKLIEHSRD